MSTAQVLAEIADEREHQRELGWDAGTDDARPLAHFGYLLAHRAVALCHPFPDAAGVDVRRLAVELAAISVALIESVDRREDR